jgi:hypothetical protein
MHLSNNAFEHLFGLLLVVFVIPIIVCSFLLYLPRLFLRSSNRL